MHIIVGGCGRVGADLAERLSDEGHDVVVIDASDEAFRRIGTTFNGEALVGDITDKEVLSRAGVERADALAAVTPSDNANLMAVQIAKELFDVPNTVARLFNPQREPSYRKMGIRAFIFSGYPHLDECEAFGRLVLPHLDTCSLPHVYDRVPADVPATPLGNGERR